MPSEVTRRGFLGTASTVAAVGAGVALAATGVVAEAAERKTIKILGICCSHRKGMTTATSLRVALDAAKAVADNVEVEMIELADFRINGLLAAGVPGEPDDFESLVPKLTDPELAGIIVGTPVYMSNMSSLCKAFIDRCSLLRKDFALANKVAGVVAVGSGRSGGQELTIRSVHDSLIGQGMILVGDAPPTGHFGGTVWSGCPGGVASDEYGMTTVKNLGRHVAEIALRLNAKTETN